MLLLLSIFAITCLFQLIGLSSVISINCKIHIHLPQEREFWRRLREEKDEGMRRSDRFVGRGRSAVPGQRGLRQQVHRELRLHPQEPQLCLPRSCRSWLLEEEDPQFGQQRWGLNFINLFHFSFHNINYGGFTSPRG